MLYGISSGLESDIQLDDYRRGFGIGNDDPLAVRPLGVQVLDDSVHCENEPKTRVLPLLRQLALSGCLVRNVPKHYLNLPLRNKTRFHNHFSDHGNLRRSRFRQLSQSLGPRLDSADGPSSSPGGAEAGRKCEAAAAYEERGHAGQLAECSGPLADRGPVPAGHDHLFG